MNSDNRKTTKPHVLALKFTKKIRFENRQKGYCFIKSQHLLHMEKHKKLIQ